MVKKETTPVEKADTGEQVPTIPTGEVSIEQKPQIDLVQLQQQIDTLKKEVAGEQRASSGKNLELQQLREELAQAKSDRETQQALMAILASREGKSEEEFGEEVQAKKPDLLAQFQTLTKSQQAQREQEKFNRAANAVWNRLLATGIKEGDDAYYEIRSILNRGELDWAESKVGKLEKQAEAPKAAEVKETEEQMRERIKQEVLRESSAFKTETGKPSGAGLSDDDFLREYSAGKRLTPEDDKRATGIIRKQTGGK